MTDRAPEMEGPICLLGLLSLPSIFDLCEAVFRTLQPPKAPCLIGQFLGFVPILSSVVDQTFLVKCQRTIGIGQIKLQIDIHMLFGLGELLLPQIHPGKKIVNAAILG